MVEKFIPYDTADYLKTEEDIAMYMEAVMEEAGGDPDFVVHALGIVARARNMSELARKTGLTREGLYKALSGEGNPSFATVAKVAGALGLRVSFQPAEPPRGKSKRVSSANPRRSAKSARGGKRIAKKQAKATGKPKHAAKRRKAA
ncbi:MAG: putative addiction module antidote protein [Rhodanobacteraceae bacterium]|nr:MAG: putative addiction module antidote protein [Rhodanobacteraceae bacterium]